MFESQVIRGRLVNSFICKEFRRPSLQCEGSLYKEQWGFIRGIGIIGFAFEKDHCLGVWRVG